MPNDKNNKYKWKFNLKSLRNGVKLLKLIASTIDHFVDGLAELYPDQNAEEQTDGCIVDN